MTDDLTPYQQVAIQTVRSRALNLKSAAQSEIEAILERQALDPDALDAATAAVRDGARIGLHFHPERLSRGGVSVAEGLLRTGIYTNQFVAGLSSGSPSAFPGGGRDQWEDRLFGGAYHGVDVTPAGRPKYGALNVMHYPDGPAPRFGSCFFLLQSSVAERASFTFGGSHEDSALNRTGTLDTMEPVFAPLLSQLDDGNGAFSIADLTVKDCLTRMARTFSTPFPDPASRPLGRALDSFIEVQVHGELRLQHDVELLVADPAFQDDSTGGLLSQLSTKFGIPLIWHPGYRMPVRDVPDFFRAYPVRRLAERIAGDGMLDAANIGAAANSVKLNPDAWNGWASAKSILTQFRRLWHVVVLAGAPRNS